MSESWPETASDACGTLLVHRLSPGDVEEGDGAEQPEADRRGGRSDHHEPAPGGLIQGSRLN